MSDRELLELAAKAAGYRYIVPSPCYNGSLGLELVINSPTHTRSWNPLTDDGDRYRLISKLKMSVDFYECTVWKRLASGELVEEFWGGDYGDEPHAILRAAAEIGKSTPDGSGT